MALVVAATSQNNKAMDKTKQFLSDTIDELHRDSGDNHAFSLTYNGMSGNTNSGSDFYGKGRSDSVDIGYLNIFGYGYGCGRGSSGGTERHNGFGRTKPNIF